MNIADIQVLGNNIVVKTAAPQKTTSFGLIIPDMAQERPDRGEVIAVGPGKKDPKGIFQPTTSKIGDRVMFGMHAGMMFTVEGEEYLTMSEDDIFGILTDE
jgi:chaperonin GroES